MLEIEFFLFYNYIQSIRGPIPLLSLDIYSVVVDLTILYPQVLEIAIISALDISSPIERSIPWWMLVI